MSDEPTTVRHPTIPDLTVEVTDPAAWVAQGWITGADAPDKPASAGASTPKRRRPRNAASK